MLKGIDISKHNGKIDFEKIKNEVDFIMIRCAYRGIANRKIFKDISFEENISNANYFNIPVGVYIYSTAINSIEAAEEAEYCLNLVKNHNIQFPIVIDIEDKKNQGNLSKSKMTEIVRSFCEKIENEGYYAMYYCSKDWYENKINKEELKVYDLWLACWNSNKSNIDCGIWQYSSKGKVTGVLGEVDLNYAFKNYPNIISKVNFNQKSRKIYKIGDMVKFNKCYSSSDSNTSLITTMNHGKITRIIDNANNPYLIEYNRCWIRESDIIED